MSWPFARLQLENTTDAPNGRRALVAAVARAIQTLATKVGGEAIDL